MILVVMQGNGEQWEDYHEHVSVVFQINKKGLTSDQIDAAHKAHITKLCSDIGLVVNPHWPEVIMEKSQQPDGKAPSKELKKIHKQILKDNHLINFIKQNYKAKELQNVETTTIY
jgi:hypothetical protein